MYEIREGYQLFEHSYLGIITYSECSINLVLKSIIIKHKSDILLNYVKVSHDKNKGKVWLTCHYVTVSDIQEILELNLCAGDAGLNRKIHKSDISRPGLEMAGYFNFYPADRVQLLGKTEIVLFFKTRTGRESWIEWKDFVQKKHRQLSLRMEWKFLKN